MRSTECRSDVRQRCSDVVLFASCNQAASSDCAQKWHPATVYWHEGRTYTPSHSGQRSRWTVSTFLFLCWRPSLSIGLAVLCFYSKTGFWPSYCQISTDLDKILHTFIVVRNTLMGRLRPRSARGGSRPNQNDYVFVILVAHPNSYIETTDRRDFGGKPSKWRWGQVLS